MFQFNFEVEDDDFVHASTSHPKADAPSEPNVTLDGFQELDLDQLFSSLPPVVSYTPTLIPTSRTSTSILPRRDLYDARFQLMSPPPEQEQSSPPAEMAFVDAPSDLVPGVYEGGLKTWECSIDLATHLATLVPEKVAIRGKNVLEVGCGTAIPSLFLLNALFQNPAPDGETLPRTVFHLQDYNRSAIELMTLPNVLLTWYLSPSAASYRAYEAEHPPSDEEADPENPVPISDADDSKSDDAPTNDMDITPTLLSAFTSFLSSQNIAIKFFSGSWEGLLSSKDSPLSNASPTSTSLYDIVLTSETIYRTASLPSLLGVLRRAASIPSSSSTSTPPYTSINKPVCLIAAKIVYFGVGGGVNEFVNAVEREGGSIENVWERSEGVGRRIMKLRW